MATTSERLIMGANSILALCGVYDEAKPGARPVGVSKLGAPVFVSDDLAKKTDLTTGATFLHVFIAMVAPFHILDKKEEEAIKRTVENSSNPKLFKTLDELYDKQKGETFIATLLKASGADGRHGLGVVAGVKLYDHWGVMSPAQKSLSIAVLSIQTHKTAEGVTICDTKIISGEGQEFKVRDALNLFEIGRNPYSLVEHWDQILKLYKVYDGKPTVEAMVDFATSHNLIGGSIKGAAVPGVTKQSIQAGGAKPAPQYGVGALAVPGGATKAPEGYTPVTQTSGGGIIVPSANAPSAAGALEGSLIGSSAGVGGISTDALGIYKKWEEAKARDKGSEGGSAFIGGLSALKKVNSYLYSAMIAFFARHATAKVDSINPIEYFASLAGIALARLVTGKSEPKADMEGIAAARQVQGNTPAEWSKVQINLRGLYATFRVSSKSDAYQLTNQAYSEDRINEEDLVAMHEIFDILYSQNGLPLVLKLIEGKDKGLKIAADKIPPAKNRMTAGQKSNHKDVLKQLKKEDLQKRNAARYAKAASQQQAEGQEQQPDQESPQEDQNEAPQQGANLSTPPSPDAGDQATAPQTDEAEPQGAPA